MRRNESPVVVRRRRASRPSILVLGDAKPSARLIEEVVMTNLAQLLELSPAYLDKNNSFIGLGGHSLLAVKLSNACKSAGIDLSLSNILLSESIDKLLNSATSFEPFTPNSPMSPAMRRRSVQFSKFDAFSHSLVPGSPTSRRRPSLVPISPTTIRRLSSTMLPDSDNTFTLTDMQLSFIHSYKKSPGTNIINFIETYNNTDIPAVKAAWKTVIEGESIFRQSFDIEATDSGRRPSKTSSFHWNDIICASDKHFKHEMESHKAPENIECSFDCVTYPESDTSTIVWRVHHAFIDGMSGQLMYEKMRKVLGGEPITSGTPFSAVAHQIKALQQATRENNRTFWKEQMDKHPQPVGELALSEPSVPDSTAAIEEVSFNIPLAKIAKASREAGVSLMAWYQAAWAMTLSMYTDSASVVFGTVLAGRNLPVKGAHDTIGPLVNTLPFHITIDPNQSVAGFLRSVFAHSVALQDMQCSAPEDGFTRSFASALAMEMDFALNDHQSRRPIGTSRFNIIPDMPLSVYMSAKGTLRLCYKPSRFLEADMKILAAHFRRAMLLLLKSDKPMNNRMSQLLTRDCKETLKEYGNCLTDDTSLISIKDDLVTLFEKAARENPTGAAIEKAGISLTYAELDRLASALAKKLEGYIQPGEVVCVHADRSINWIVAIYGIFKAGGVYSAQDAALPAHIRDMNFQTSGATLFLTPADSQKYIKPDSCNLVLSVEELVLKQLPTEYQGLPHRTTPRINDNAYLCFTSGSTGKPKGCMCHHAGLVAFQKDPEVRFFAAPGVRIAQVMSPAFDGSIHEIFSALSYGATLVLTDGIDPFAHIKKSNAALLTPSVAKILEPRDFPNLRTLYVVGEPVPQYVNDLWSRHVNLQNMYGPTEATCGATIQKLSPGRKVTIGAPNPTTRIYILDRNQQLVPPGVVGEIYCAGVQVARGYVGRPELTAEKFLPDTIEKRPGEMMYRTGDRGFFNHNGEVECLGRNDRQIKLRGYRTDLNDIEMRVAQGIPECTAVAICQKDDYLVAMIQPETLDMSDVRARVMKTVPIHAVPRIIRAVEKFPFTPAGKIDYKKIAEVCTTAAPVAAATKLSVTESQIAQVWRDLLALPETDKISGDSNFAELGGHSVLQLRLASKLSSVYKQNIPMAKIIGASTLSDMAKIVDEIKGSAKSEANSGLIPLGLNNVAPIEAEWVKKYEIQRGTSAFNVTFAAAIDEEKIDVDHLAASWNAVLARYPIFRSRYHPSEKHPHGVSRQLSRYCPQVVRLDEDSFDLWREVNRPFHLDRQNPIRVFITESTMLASMSHIIADLTTLQVVLKEVMQLYNEEALPRVQRKYADTVQWASEATDTQKKWWQEYLHGSEASQHLVSQLPKRSAYDGVTRLTQLPKPMAKRLLQYSMQNKVTLHQMALGAVALALQTDSDNTDMVLGGPYFNRGADDVETVGLFLEPIPIRIQHSNEKGSFMSTVQSASQSAIANAIPWNQILSAVGKAEPSFPNHSLTDVMVTFHDDRTAPKLPIEGIDPLVTYTKGSKFTLLVEFCAVSEDTVLLRLEYDNTLISDTEIQRIWNLLEEALESIVAGKSYTEIKERLRNVSLNEKEDSVVENYFGKSFAAFKN
ncbi:acetyl-CoA synthetase-like protein [Cucurbitaria berberidis CBS 394.84]|uniref:Acetyl-CoA synthetase-like protein n=1 Tax=Cucurbitaria berberidis CBS 394.84 TaxID=1168544 RepID=A0A9P4G717_9PLEO|nr:acetyl-CoA synthetase-like protein [Cucurbitaria berberidis CBS 394.84]KAF1840228.1 acetyl-CoA synthetase-like protein [Cucurbitaria berberidis CBS 394.84]